MKYSRRIKESALRKVLPPENRSVPDVAREMGISDQTIYNWKKKAENNTFSQLKCFVSGNSINNAIHQTWV